MIVPGSAPRIVVATRPVDFRKGHDALAALVEHELGLDPFSGVVVVFRPKRLDRIKVLWWDGTGLVLASKRLEQGRFAWPSVRDGVIRLSRVRGVVRGSRLAPGVAASGPPAARGGIASGPGFYLLSVDFMIVLCRRRAQAWSIQQLRVEGQSAFAPRLSDRNRRLEHLLNELRRALHGQKVHPDQFQLAFEELEGALAEAEEEAPASTACAPRPKASGPPAARGGMTEGRLPVPDFIY